MKTNILHNIINNVRVCAIMVVCLMAFGVGTVWGAPTTIASWGKVSIAASTAIKASGGDANNKDKAQFSSTKAMTTAGTYCYYGASAGGAVITFSNLNLSGYTDITMTFYTRASQQGNMKIQYTTNGSTWTDLDSPGPSITKSEAQKTSSTIPNTATGLKLTHSKSSGSLYFGTITISGTAAAASCGVPTSPTNGAKTATTQPVSWSAPSPAPENGYVVAVSETNTAPNTNVTITNGNAYQSGDYYYAHIAAGTRNYTFSTASGPCLTAGTTYYWWVRSKCGASDYSAWVAGTAFTIPNIVVSETAIDGLDYDVSAGGPSDAKTFTVSGTGLTGNLTVALDEGASSKFEISKTSASSGYGNSLSLTQSSGTVSTTTIWVRLKSGKSAGDYIEGITISGGTATAKEVVIEGIVCSKLAAPTGLNVDENYGGTHGRIRLTWDAVSNASGYRVYMSKNGGAEAHVDKAVGERSYIHTMDPGNYTWRVVALGDGTTYCSEGTSAAGSDFCVGADLTGSTPTGLSISNVASTSVRFNWTAVANAAKYKMSVKNSGTPIAGFDNKETTNTYMDVTGLTAGTTYTAEVTAYNACEDAYNSPTANTTIKILTVTFDSDGGSAVATQYVNTGGKATTPSPAPTKTCCTLEGWKNGGSAYNFNSTVTTNLSLTADWSTTHYTITYNGGAKGTGGGPASAGDKTCGVAFTLSSDKYTNASEKQDGWATEENGSKVYEMGGSYTANANITLFPHWTAKTYTNYRTTCAETFDIVLHDNNGGSHNGSAKVADGDTKLTSIVAPTRDHYHVLSYHTGTTPSNANKICDNTGNPLTSGLTGYTDGTGHWNKGTGATFYAKWEINSNTLTWEYDGGTPSGSYTAAGPVAYGTSLTAPTVTKTGYTFNAWSPAVPSTMDDADATYTATWTAHTYSVQFNANGGSGSMSDQNFTYGVAQNLSTCTFTHATKAFGGWTTNSDGTGDEYANGESVSNLSSEQGAVINLYAKWVDCSLYTVTLKVHNATYQVLQQASCGAAVNLTGITPLSSCSGDYTFVGWSTTDPGTTTAPSITTSYTPTSNTTLYAVYSYSANTLTLVKSLTGFGGAYKSYVIAASGYNFAMGEFDACGTVDGVAISKDGDNCSKTGSGELAEFYFEDAGSSKWFIYQPYTDSESNYGNMYMKAPTGSGGKFCWYDDEDYAVWWIDDDDIKPYGYYDYEYIETYMKSHATDALWSLSINGETGVATLTAVDAGSNTRNWNFNNSATKFATYTSSQKPIAIYEYSDATAYTTQPEITYYTVAKGAETNGTISISAGIACSGQNVSVGATPNTGYEFSSWSVSSGTGTFGASTASTTFTPTSNATITAVFNAEQYSITYKDQGNVAFSGTHETGHPTTHTYGTATTLKSATKTGYTFGGWYTASDCASGLVTSLGATDYTADITLYAKWTENTYDVTFYNGGHGTVQVAGATIANGGTASVNHFTTKTLEATASTGYTFAGWTTTGSVTLGDASAATTTILATAAGGTVTATWTANTIALTLHKNNSDGSGSTPGSASILFDATSVKASPAMVAATRTGYTVEGYYTDAACTAANKVLDASGNVVNSTVSDYTTSGKWTRATTPTTLYTKWTAKSCTVNFDKQGGTGGDNSATATYGSAMPTITAPTKDGYTFAGYWDEVGGAVTQYYNGTGTSKRNWNKDRTEAIYLYAKWTQSITLDKNGGSTVGKVTTVTYNAGGPLTVNTVPTRTGYTVEGYYAESGCEHKVMTDAGALVNYSGWVEDGKWIHSGASTLYTKWTEDTHTVTVAAGANGSVDPTSVNGVGIATASGDINATPNTGYHFVNWTLPDGVTAASTYSATSNPIHINATADGKTITANFAANSYDITLNTNGGTINAGDVTSYTYGVGATLPTNVTKTGYTFGGWYDNSSLTGSAVTTISTSATGDKEYWAKWTAITYLVRFNKNDGSATGTMDNESFTYDVAKALTTNAFSKTGYNFSGWATSAGGSVAYTDGQSVSNLSSTQDAVVDLYAKWTAKTITITWNPNGAGASVTPTSSSYTYDGSTVDLPTPTRSLHAFDGWYTEASGGTQITEVGTTNKPTTDVTYYAHWRALTFEVKDQAGTGTADIHLTSTNGVAVYATSACGNLITIKANNLDAISNLGGGTANKQQIQIKYLDANNGDAEVAKTSSPFRLCNNGSSNYNYVDASSSNININGLTEYSQTYSISYTPTAYGVTDHYKLQLRLQNNNTEAITIQFDLYGRSLPDEFVIAAKYADDGKWYALPNTLKSDDSQPSIVPVEITVDNTATPTKAMNAPSTLLYKACDRYKNSPNTQFASVRFTSDGTNHLQASSGASSYQLWLTPSDNAVAQNWYLKSSDFGAYEMQWDPAQGSTKLLGFYNSSGIKMGFHGTAPKGHDIYFLPVEYADMSAEIMEWGTDHVVVDLRSAGSATKVKTQVGQGALSSAQTLASIKKDEGVYRVAVTLSESDAAKNLKLLFYNDSEVMQGGAKNTIPLLISDDDATTGSLSLSKDDAATCDLVVLDGGVLTVSETTDGAKYTFQDLYVYGGGKMVVPSGRYISFSNVYMRGGHLNSSWEYQYSNPQLILNGTMGNSSNTINYDYLTNNAQFYSLALPYQVQLANIVNPYFNNKRSWEIHAYDGAKRASGSQVDGWYDVEVGSTGANTGNIAALTSSSYLTPGVGYTFWGAMQKVNSIRQKWSINRFPMTLASGSAETAKAGVSVGAYGMTDGMPNDGVAVNDAGWNMLGNPYLANIGGTESFESSLSALIVGYHNEKELDGSGNWTGAWKEVEDAANVRYVRIPHDNGMDYDQVRVKDATFKSFRHFFIQAATSGTFTFSLSQRAQEAPARVQNNGATLPDEMDIDFILSNGEEQATFGLTVNDKLNTGFVVGEDMPEELGGTSSKAYTIAAENKLAYNGLPSTAAEQYIPVGYRAEAAGTYTFAYKPDEYTTYIEHIRLIDYATGDVTDLLDDTYEFSTEQGIFDERFALNVEFVRYNTPTGMEGTGINADQPVKFIRDDKMYILRNGVIYDATGKRVIEINK